MKSGTASLYQSLVFNSIEKIHFLREKGCFFALYMIKWSDLKTYPLYGGAFLWRRQRTALVRQNENAENNDEEGEES
jgi:hypothetical protein